MPLLNCSGLTKSFGSTDVLKDIDFELHGGESVAVLGENGAGKSTLMKMLAGYYPAGSYKGFIKLQGKEASFRSVHDAEAAGVVMVPQELHVVPHLSIAENMFAGNLPGRRGIFSRREADRAARSALAVFSLDVDPSLPADVLSPSERRLIVLASALAKSARVLILDEPTAALTDSETQKLLAHVNLIRDKGVGVLYITHRLDELDKVASRSVVLRNGQVTRTFGAQPPRHEVVEAMIGAKLLARDQAAPKPGITQSMPKAVLEVHGMNVFAHDRDRRPRVTDATFAVNAGEIVGLYGLVGAGRTELGNALFGAWPGEVTGTCEIGETTGFPASTGDAITRGVSLLVEDRKSQGVFPGHDLASNFSASVLKQLGRGPLVDKRRERIRNKQLLTDLGVRPPNLDLPIEKLSGGNQQKVLIGRCLIKDLRVLILDEPTLGVDVGARRDIYELMKSLSREMEVGILMISSDAEEVRQEADRTLVMYKGRIVREFGPNPSTHALLSAATGA